MAKQKFKNKRSFILTCVGAAVGLGNALRFPGLCARFGGGAYLSVYLVALIFLGVPLLNAEIALGRKYLGGAPKCMQALKRGGGRLGWTSCVNSLITAVIYAGLAGWLLTMVIKIAPLCTGGSANVSEYFFDNVLNARDDGVISGISPLVAAGIAASWVLMFLCLSGGTDSLSKAAKFTVTVPVALLLVMAARGFLYQNAGKALKALFLPDFSAFLNPELWLSALGQVFFSLSVAVGIMPAFGACLPEGTNVFSCSLAIAAADFAVSVLASVVMFTTLYGCGLQNQIGQSGILTAFAVYPAAICRLSQFPALNAAVGVLFYCSLCMMAVQSAVSMLEAFLSPLAEGFNLKKRRLTMCVCAVGGTISLVFATSAAPLIVSIADLFINFYDVLLLCILECFIIGYSRESRNLANEINRFSGRLKMPEKVFKASVKFVSPAVLVSLASYEAVRLFINGLSFPLWAQIGFGWGLSLAVLAAALLLQKLTLPRVSEGRKKLFKAHKRANC
ncbi:MAG: sodium-dependent transporter [Clostridia bacterium]|nr:sodium-dependent transporter [Clostridia bacterium]